MPPSSGLMVRLQGFSPLSLQHGHKVPVGIQDPSFKLNSGGLIFSIEDYAPIDTRICQFRRGPVEGDKIYLVTPQKRSNPVSEFEVTIPWDCTGIKDPDIDITERPFPVPRRGTKEIRQNHPPLSLEEVPKHRYQTLVGKPRSLHREQDTLHRLPNMVAFLDCPGRKTHALGDGGHVPPQIRGHILVLEPALFPGEITKEPSCRNT